MDNLPVSYPSNLFEWLAFKEIYRDNFLALEPDDIAVLYGLCSLQPFRDEEYCKKIEAYLGQGKELCHMRYELAYYLASTFFSEYDSLRKVNISQEPNVYQYRLKRPDEPGYVEELPKAFMDQIKSWLIDGIRAYRDNDELMDMTRNLKYRYLGGYSYFTKEDITELEVAMGEEIDFRKDPKAIARIQSVTEYLSGLQKGEEDENLQSGEPS